MQGRLHSEVDHRGFCHQFLRRFWLTHFLSRGSTHTRPPHLQHVQRLLVELCKGITHGYMEAQGVNTYASNAFKDL